VPLLPDSCGSKSRDWWYAVSAAAGGWYSSIPRYLFCSEGRGLDAVAVVSAREITRWGIEDFHYRSWRVTGGKTFRSTPEGLPIISRVASMTTDQTTKNFADE